MPLRRRAHRFRGQHRLDFAIAAQGFFQQVEGFGHAQPCWVRAPRTMARRTSFSSGLAALVIVSAFGI